MITEAQLTKMSALCQDPLADMEGTPQACLRDAIAEIRRLSSENVELKNPKCARCENDMPPSYICGACNHEAMGA